MIGGGTIISHNNQYSTVHMQSFLLLLLLLVGKTCYQSCGEVVLHGGLRNDPFAADRGEKFWDLEILNQQGLVVSSSVSDTEFGFQSC